MGRRVLEISEIFHGSYRCGEVRKTSSQVGDRNVS